MSQQKPPLIVKISSTKISSSLSTAIFDCGIYSNWQINVYWMSTVKFNLGKFHSHTITQTPHSAWTSSVIQLWV